MIERTTSRPPRVFQDTSYASLCALGLHLRRSGVLDTLIQGCTIRQKTRSYTPAQKVTMIFAGLLTGITGIARINALRSDSALLAAFGLPGCAEQSVLSDTLSAATDADVTAVRQASEQVLQRFSRALHHDFGASLLTLDLDLSPAPASKRCAGSVRSYQGKARRHYGRKIIRVLARLQYGETLWDDVLYGNRTEALPLVELAVAAIERLLGIESTVEGQGEAAQERVSEQAAFIRSRIEWRMDSGWGIDAVITYLLGRGYQVIGKVHNNRRIARLAQAASDWQPARHPGTELAMVTTPVVYERPVQQLVVRTPAPTEGTYGYTVFFCSRMDLTPHAVLAQYDRRAGIEADLKSDKRGLGMVTIRKHQLPAQRLLIVLIDLAHNILTWAREWLGVHHPHLASFGIVRLIRDVFAIPGRVKIKEHTIERIRLREGHPHANVLAAVVTALVQDEIPAFLGQN